MKDRLFLSLPSDTHYLSVLESFYKNFIRLNKIDNNFNADNLFLAIVEAVVNGMKHGNKGDLSKNVSISFELKLNEIIVTISDEGKGFEPDALPDPTNSERLGVPSGRGVYLIKKLVDDYKYIFNENGTTVILKMRW